MSHRNGTWSLPRIRPQFRLLEKRCPKTDMARFDYYKYWRVNQIWI